MDYSDISSLILFIFLCLWIVLDYFFECSDASSFTTTATASTSSGDINIEVLDRPRRGGSTTSTANTSNVDINIQVFDRHGGRRTTPAASHGDINIEVVDRRRGGGRTTTTTTTSTSTSSLGDISNQRLDRGVLSKLPTFNIDEETKQQLDECSVCLMEFEDGEKARRLLPCSHCFHVKCIDMWLDSHSTCPLCKGLVGSLDV